MGGGGALHRQQANHVPSRWPLTSTVAHHPAANSSAKHCDATAQYSTTKGLAADKHRTGSQVRNPLGGNNLLAPNRQPHPTRGAVCVHQVIHVKASYPAKTRITGIPIELLSSLQTHAASPPARRRSALVVANVPGTCVEAGPRPRRDVVGGTNRQLPRAQMVLASPARTGCIQSRQG